MTRFVWFRSRLMELVVALLAVYVILGLADRIKDQQRRIVTPETWFQVNEVYVPDHVMGSNPEMIYDRLILEQFEGFWIVEVQRETLRGLWANACSGSGANDYDPLEIIEDDTVTWQWFIGRPCAVEPGRYRLRVSYTLTRPDWPAKRVVVLSNLFSVLPPS